MATILTGAKQQSYTLSGKVGIVNFTGHQENCATEQDYEVLECNVQLWQKGKENL